MDAGLAALAGAGLGVLGTAATGGLAAWATRWQARMQVQVGQNQARQQARRVAYTKLLRSVTAVRASIGETVDALRASTPDPDECHSLFGAARALGREWDAASSAVLMEGPDAVAQAALPLINSVNKECDEVRRWCAAVAKADQNIAKDARAGYKIAWGNSQPLLERFINVARAGLPEQIETY